MQEIKHTTENSQGKNEPKVKNEEKDMQFKEDIKEKSEEEKELGEREPNKDHKEEEGEN